MIVKFLVMAEIEVPDGTANPEGEAQLKFDNFREATLPSRDWGIFIYRIGEAEFERRRALGLR